MLDPSRTCALRGKLGVCVDRRSFGTAELRLDIIGVANESGKCWRRTEINRLPEQRGTRPGVTPTFKYTPPETRSLGLYMVIRGSARRRGARHGTPECARHLLSRNGRYFGAVRRAEVKSDRVRGCRRSGSETRAPRLRVVSSAYGKRHEFDTTQARVNSIFSTL
jgi:hypothetical protein